MMNLVPRDHWEHRLGDVIRSFAAAFGSREKARSLDLPGLGSTVPVCSGRAALATAIKALGLRAGARIGVPLYCCPVVFEAIVTAGCAPLFIDIDPGTFCLSPEDLARKQSRLDALVVVHMFGNICPVDELMSTFPGRPIIEDCAQALGSTMLGRPAGKLGVSAGEGGALYSANPAILARAAEIIGAMPAPSRAGEFMQAVKIYLKSLLRTKPLYGLIGHRLWSSYAKRTDVSERDTVGLGSIYLADLQTAENRLPLLASQIQKQRANAEYYSKSLRLAPGMICSEKPGASYNRYLYPLTFSSPGERDELAAYLLCRRIDTMKYLDHVVETASACYGYQGDCPVAEGLSRRVLVIPSYHSLAEKDIQRIARLVNAGWEGMARKSMA
jgi:perosamine synthetase